MLTVAQTMQNIWNFMVGKSTRNNDLAIIPEISYSNLETGRYGLKIIWSLPDCARELTGLDNKSAYCVILQQGV